MSVQNSLPVAPCLSALPESVRDAIRRRSSPRLLSKGSVITRQGSVDSRIVVLLSGRLKLTRLAEGGRLRTLRILNPGECFCYAPLDGGVPSPVTVACLTDAEVVSVRGDELAALIEGVPGAARHMVGCLSERLAESMKEAADAPNLPVSRKLASVLTGLARAHSASAPGPVLLEGITHEELASLAGTVREVASRTLGLFERQGMLKTGRGRITILDRELLERAASGSAEAGH